MHSVRPYPARVRTAGLVSLAAFALATFVSAQTAPQKPDSDIVQLEAFTVSTEIDSYHQQTSSMANKLPTDLRELPSSLSILNSAAITDRSAVTMSDVFSYVTGAAQSQNASNGFSFRGFPNTGSYSQNIQFDGLMGTTLKKAGASAANVDSLEFLKGPNGVLYGQMNPGGLLNIVTKSPSERQQTYVRFTVGTFEGSFTSAGTRNTETASIDTTGPVGNSTHLFYRMIVDADSNPSSRPGNWDHSLSIFPAFTYKWTKDTSFTVKLESSEDFRRQDDGMVPIFTSTPITVNIGGVNTLTAAYGSNASYYLAPYNTVYNDNGDKATDRGSALSTFFHTQLPGGWTLRIQSRAVWHLDIVREETVNNANVFTPKASYATPISKLIRQYNYVKNGHRYDYADANIYRDFDLGVVKQTVLIGIGGGGEFFGNSRLAFGPNQPVANAIALTNPILNQAAYPADGTGSTNQLTWQSALGEYVSDQVKVGDSVHLSLGLRHDYNQVHGLNTLTPALTTFATQLGTFTRQVGAVYDVTHDVSVYGSWSQSIKPQTNIAFDASGNSSFPPESGEQYEGGVKFETPNRNLNITLATYEINRTNVVVASGTNFTVPTGAAQVGQAISRLDGKQTSKGVEFETQWQPMPNWQLQLGYAYSKAIIAASVKNPTTVGLDLANAPRETGNFWTRYNFPVGELKGLGFGTGVIYVGKAWAGDPTTALYYNMPGWARVDASAFYKWRHYDLALNVQNVLDRRYISGAQSALTLNIGDQRKFTLSVGTRF